MASEYKAVLTETAKKDLDDSVSYIYYGLSNPIAAEAHLKRFSDALGEILLFPFSSPEIDNELVTVQGIRKKPFGNYMIYYLPDKENCVITILRVVYGPQDIMNVLFSL